MRANTFRRAAVLFPVVVIVVWAMRPAIGQSPISLQPKPGEWRTYGSDLASTHYSPLDQISAANFNKLEVAWRFKTDAQGPRPEFNLESTPLVANGVMYSTAGHAPIGGGARRRHRRASVEIQPQRGEAGRGRAAPALGPRSVGTGPTAARNGSSTSRPDIRWSRSTRRPAIPSPVSARTASSI